MKATKSTIGRLVEQPDPNVRLYLFLGPDEGQSRALAATLLQSLGASKLALSQAELKADPALLAEEAAALSLFGERRLIWIEPAGNDLVDPVETLLLAPSVESPAVAIAGALAKSSALLKLVEGSPAALAYTAYVPEGAEAVRVVVELGRRLGVKMSTPIAARLAESCANDQAVVARELEKLALFVDASPHSPKELGHEAIDEVGAGSGEASFLKLGDLALLGETEELGGILARLPAPGSEGVPVARALQRRIVMLAAARSRIEAGERVDAAMASFGKSLFWKEKTTVEKMLRTWTAHELARLAERAGILEQSLMLTAVPEREALGEELLAVARKARGRRA